MSPSMRIHGAACALAAAILLAQAADARAGGMNLHTRGVRPSARGGAFVAGADDLGALWFNPAGLDHIKSKHSALFDVAFVAQSIEYTRVDSYQNAYDPVTNQAPGLPVPSLAVSHRFDQKLSGAVGIYAPYAGLAKFDPDGPQRYSLIDLSESLLVVLSAGASYQIDRGLRIGATVQNMFFSMSSVVVMGGCAGETVCAPENPDWDSPVKITQFDWFSPSFSVGAQADFGTLLTAGLSLQAPFHISGRGKVQTKLPDAPLFEAASIDGDRADVSFWMPPVVRAGIELHPGRWRFEAAIDAEFWAIHDEMRIEPKDVHIVNLPGIKEYDLAPVVIPRHYRNSYAMSIGGEGQPLASIPLRVLAGYTYETAAAPSEYLSVLTVDGAKNVFAGGLGYRFGRFSIEAMASYAAMKDRTVTPPAPMGPPAPGTGQAPQLTPIRDPGMERLPIYVNAGTYRSSWLAAGLGLSASF